MSYFDYSRCRKLEQIVKGFANNRRILILELLHRQPGLQVVTIADRLDMNMKTIAVHVDRLERSGLVVGLRAGFGIEHKITARGRSVLSFLRNLEH